MEKINRIDKKRDGLEGQNYSLLHGRILPVLLILLTIVGIMTVRLFHLQMIESTNVNPEENQTSYTRTIPITASRGNIYDANGVLLAHNELAYHLELYDSAALATNDEKNAALYELITLMRQFGFEREFSFFIALDEEGQLQFTVDGQALLRCKKNAYGLTSVSKLSEEQIAATAEEVFAFLRYGDKSSKMFQINESYTIEDALEICAYRYQLFTMYPSYQSFRLVSNISDEARIAFYENAAKVPGLEITRRSVRVYDKPIYFSHILGYVGLINEAELEELSALDDKYTESSIVGKAGIEKSFETYLAGIDGEMTLELNSRGQVVSKRVTREPVSGNNLYLTIDSELQTAAYHILERNIAGILLSKIVPTLDYGSKGESASDIVIPVYEVYFALLNNRVLDRMHFYAEDASEAERKILAQYESEEEEIWVRLQELLAADCTATGREVGETMQEYLDFVYDMLGSSNWGVLLSHDIDTTDEVYRQFAANEVSLSQFLQYAITKNWISLDKLDLGQDYYEAAELYQYLYAYIFAHLREEETYQLRIYRTLIFNYELKGRDFCLALFDQGVLKEDTESYAKLKSGSLSSYDFLCRKIKLMEITPAMLALEPCSGSIVTTDPNTGTIRCLVSYPSYDNNYLTNSIDSEYYEKLLRDKSFPLVNRATSSKTTTGSTIKPLTGIMGLMEGVITPYTKIEDKIVFEEIVPSPSCWSKYSHGAINVTDAIRHSCNYFFYEIGYKLSLNERGLYDDARGMNTLQRYASLFGLSEKSGVEISEAQPIISNKDAVRSAIGYGHSFAPIQIARYLTTLTNEGTCYQLTMLDRIEAQNGELVLSNSATVRNEITEVSDSSWKAIKLGMHQVINAERASLNKVFSDLRVKVAGKTGTAQVSLNHPNNALFISFAPYQKPEICTTVVIPNGYASANAAYVCREFYGFYFAGENRDALLSGKVFAGNITDVEVGD